MDVPVWAWLVTIGVILAMLAVDYVGHVRTPHAPSLREASWWSAGYVAVAVVFGGIVWAVWGSTYGGEYFAGYITEKSLSVDNLFVFVLIMTSFRVPRLYQQKVLLIGITIALVLRTIFILLGAALIENFSWIFYVFGAFLLYTAWTQVKAGSGHDEEFHENGALKLTRRLFPTTETYVEDKMTTKIDGKRFITPMLIVMIASGRRCRRSPSCSSSTCSSSDADRTSRPCARARCGSGSTSRSRLSSGRSSERWVARHRPGSSTPGGSPSTASRWTTCSSS